MDGRIIDEQKNRSILRDRNMYGEIEILRVVVIKTINRMIKAKHV